jgi:hypothetical protein
MCVGGDAVNESECYVADWLRKEGFQVYRNGWPDFFVYNPTSEQYFGVEVKRATPKLRREQQEMHDVLRQCGFPSIIMVSEKLMKREMLDDLCQRPLRAVLNPPRPISYVESFINLSVHSVWRNLRDLKNELDDMINLFRMGVNELEFVEEECKERMHIGDIEEAKERFRILSV